MKLSNISVRNKLFSLVAFSSVLLISACLYNLNEQKKSALHERESKLRSQVEVVVSLLDHFYQLRNDIGIENAKLEAMKAIQTIRYDGDNYFWILTPNSKVILHPAKPELNGVDAKSFKDGAGKFHWQEMVQIAQKSGSGFIDYRWLSPEGDLKDKISYVQLYPEWEWIVGSGILVADIQETFYEDAVKEAIVATILIAALSVLGYLISNNIVEPLRKLVKNIHKIADGDLTVRMNVSRTDELGEMSNEIDRMLEKLRDTLTMAHESAQQSSNLAYSIAQASEEVATSVNNQHSQLEVISTAMAEMSTTISDVASNAESTAQSTALVTGYAEQSGCEMEKTTKTISDVSHNIASANQMVVELQAGVNEISAVVSVIRDVSEQTNLLALNAAIEAARAGDQGRGFAVVADEVRNLAGRTQQSTDEVQQTIDSLVKRTLRTVEAMEQSNLKVEQSVTISQSTQSQLTTMVEELSRSNDMAAQIAAASEQQGLVANEMTQNVMAIHLAANEVKDASQMLAKESQNLATTSQLLNEQLKHFKV
ncbi:methyl-accepting chemotaxis protein [Vibrio sinensis]|uniref:Methyl-accepting chemotaxis protein n=1 Tax=Vibrio sinensis TaxID=2302434 RepID=A0A3A6R494_9VIBR|nr:methyl-accepting chemotaxis protein [Vibrio sinensis]RJX75799.1 methyl-accepting chemotaxis protein [Vibrio sinensis]